MTRGGLSQRAASRLPVSPSGPSTLPTCGSTKSLLPVSTGAPSCHRVRALAATLHARALEGTSPPAGPRVSASSEICPCSSASDGSLSVACLTPCKTCLVGPVVSCCPLDKWTAETPEWAGAWAWLGPSKGQTQCLLEPLSAQGRPCLTLEKQRWTKQTHGSSLHCAEALPWKVARRAQLCPQARVLLPEPGPPCRTRTVVCPEN